LLGKGATIAPIRCARHGRPPAGLAEAARTRSSTGGRGRPWPISWRQPGRPCRDGRICRWRTAS